MSIALLRVLAVLAQTTSTFAASGTTSSAAPSCTAPSSPVSAAIRHQVPNSPSPAMVEPSAGTIAMPIPPATLSSSPLATPYTGTGTCWLYPGESFDASAGSSDCANPSLSVYSQPVCSGNGAPTTSGACAATATPSAVASVCGYPTPGDCFSTCSASGSASDCLSQCVKADSCSYVVFNPHNPSNSPYASGSCWMYPNGTYDAGAATACSGQPEQFVYENLCPKPSPSSSSASSVTPPSSAAPSKGTGTPGSATAGRWRLLEVECGRELQQVGLLVLELQALLQR